MIVQENLTINGRAFVRTYSDTGKYVVREGISYEEAIDPAGLNRVYTEGAEMPVLPEDKAEAYDILMGVSQ